MWKVQYPPRYTYSPVTIVTASASMAAAAPTNGNPIYMDSFSGGLDQGRQVALFLYVRRW